MILIHIVWINKLVFCLGLFWFKILKISKQVKSTFDWFFFFFCVCTQLFSCSWRQAPEWQQSNEWPCQSNISTEETKNRSLGKKAFRGKYQQNKTLNESRFCLIFRGNHLLVPVHPAQLGPGTLLYAQRWSLLPFLHMQQTKTLRVRQPILYLRVQLNPLRWWRRNKTQHVAHLLLHHLYIPPIP